MKNIKTFISLVACKNLEGANAKRERISNHFAETDTKAKTTAVEQENFSNVKVHWVREKTPEKKHTN